MKIPRVSSPMIHIDVNDLFCMCGDNKDKDDGWKLLHELRCNPVTMHMILDAQEKVMNDIQDKVDRWTEKLEYL